MNALAPLRLRPFRSLFLARLVNEAGYWFGTVALAVLVYDETSSALATMALFLGIEFLPSLLAPPLVARIDLVPSRLSLPVIYVGEAAAFLLLAAITESFSLALVIVLATVDGMLALAARALTRALAATLLKPRGQLRAGNALLNVGFTAAAAAAPGLAGLVVAGSEPRVAFLVAAACLALVGLTLGATRSLPVRPGGEEGARREPWWPRFRAGLGYVRRHPLLRVLFAGQGLAFVFFAAVVPIEIVYAKESLRAGDAGYGLLLTAWGAGMVAGSLLFAGSGRVPLRLVLFASTLAVGAAYLIMGGAGTLALAAGAAGLGGVGNGIQWVALMSAVQEGTPGAYQARVVGMLESLGAGMTGVGFVVGGIVAATIDPRAAFVIAGAGVLVVVAAVVGAVRRTGWRGAPAPEPGVTAPLSPLERGKPADQRASP
jgi:MFS family permease